MPLYSLSPKSRYGGLGILSVPDGVPVGPTPKVTPPSTGSSGGPQPYANEDVLRKLKGG
jgi:hypothetical protein